MSLKNPLTPTGIEPATFRFVAQHLNHCATTVAIYFMYSVKSRAQLLWDRYTIHQSLASNGVEYEETWFQERCKAFCRVWWIARGIGACEIVFVLVKRSALCIAHATTSQILFTYKAALNTICCFRFTVARNVVSVPRFWWPTLSFFPVCRPKHLTYNSALDQMPQTQRTSAFAGHYLSL